jgi:hypothetical protein
MLYSLQDRASSFHKVERIAYCAYQIKCSLDEATVRTINYHRRKFVNEVVCLLDSILRLTASRT